MTRHRLAFLTASILAAVAMPALAQNGPPPPPADVPPPSWIDPQAPQYPGSDAIPHDGAWHGAQKDRPDFAGAPFARPLPPEGYRAGPAPDPRGPMGRGPVGSDYGYGFAYRYGTGSAPCACGRYAYPPVMWVRVPVETRYRYSAPIRHENQVVEEKVVTEDVAETKIVPAHRKAKYVKSPRRPKQTKGKVVRKTR
jgi:hypothetical protein